MKYLLVIGYDYSDRNKAQAHIKHLLKGMDRNVFASENEVQNYLNDVSKTVAELLPRTKKIDLNVWSTHNGDLKISDGKFCTGMDLTFHCFEKEEEQLKNGKVIGLYSCSCHLFESYDAAKIARTQKLNIGQPVTHRCSGKVGSIYAIESGGYVTVKYGPLASDIQLEHVQNLIKKEVENAY